MIGLKLCRCKLRFSKYVYFAMGLPCLVLSTANVFLKCVIPTCMEEERDVKEPNSVMPRQAATATLFLPNLGRWRLNRRTR